MFVKPAPGVKVRDPISMLHIPEEGRDVPENNYWTRKIAAGDVVRVAAPESGVVVIDQIPDSTSKAEE